MGSWTFLLLVLVLLIFTDHSQGVPETHGQSLIANTFNNASAVGKPLTTANPINTPRQHKRLRNCKGHPGKGSGMMNTLHCCKQYKRNGKLEKWEKLCQRKENKKDGNIRKFGPSVPI